jgi:hypothetical protein
VTGSVSASRFANSHSSTSAQAGATNTTSTEDIDMFANFADFGIATHLLPTTGKCSTVSHVFVSIHETSYLSTPHDPTDLPDFLKTYVRTHTYNSHNLKIQYFRTYPLISVSVYRSSISLAFPVLTHSFQPIIKGTPIYLLISFKIFSV